MRPPKRNIGFTLIELMIVVAILGLVAAIAIPKFGGMIVRSKEASIKGKLTAFRSAISIYYADNEGIVPGNFALVFLPNSKYLENIPQISIPTVSAHTLGDGVSSLFATGDWSGGAPYYGGHATLRAWVFNSSTGKVYVNCTHTDTSGRTWSTW